MRHSSDLEPVLREIDGRGYKAYKTLEGLWDFGDFVLEVDHVQADPFAAPTRVRVRVPPETTRLEPTAVATSARRRGTACFLAHALARTARSHSRSRGTGRSGEIGVTHPGQLVLPQTAVLLDPEGSVEARFTVGLPARGRRVSAPEATQLLLGDVPEVVLGALRGAVHGPEPIELHAAAAEDATALRAQLHERGLVAFVADGARLPRRSGIDDRPMEGGEVVPFASPPSLRVEMEVPNAGRVTGMGIPEGITLIVGGGFHGKSTLLRALQDGVYDHRPGDGREQVVTRGDAVKIRAEDGRAVTGVDISSFIDGLPLGHPTHAFTTPNASGSTSQAAGIVEALEAGSRLLLVDEDTSATNFMIRDRRMQTLVPPEGEPITPFVDRVRELHARHGVSTVLVVGGSGDYLDVADTVIRMTEYLPVDVTEEALDVARSLPTGRTPESARPFALPEARRVQRDCLDASRGRRDRYVRVPDGRTLLVGRSEVDLTAAEQIVLRGQLRAIGEALGWISGEAEGDLTVPEILDRVEAAWADRGLDALAPWPTGELAAFRRYELAVALNRLRSLRVAGPPPSRDRAGDGAGTP